jgi:hypothetical protein
MLKPRDVYRCADSLRRSTWEPTTEPFSGRCYTASWAGRRRRWRDRGQQQEVAVRPSWSVRGEMFTPPERHRFEAGMGIQRPHHATDVVPHRIPAEV